MTPGSASARDVLMALSMPTNSTSSTMTWMFSQLGDPVEISTVIAAVGNCRLALLPVLAFKHVDSHAISMRGAHDTVFISLFDPFGQGSRNKAVSPLLSYELSSSCAKLEQLPGRAFMPGSGGGRTVPLLVNVDRAQVWSPPSFLTT